MTDHPPAPRPPRAAPELLDLLVCPVTNVPLRYEAQAQELISDQAGLAFPICDGIPVLLPERARVLDATNK